MKLFEVRTEHPYKNLYIVATDFNDACNKALDHLREKQGASVVNEYGDLTIEAKETKVEYVKMLTDEVIR